MVEYLRVFHHVGFFVAVALGARNDVEAAIGRATINTALLTDTAKVARHNRAS